MKKFLICFIFMIAVATTVGAASLDAYVDYDNSIINASYETGVSYGPMVSLIVYKPDANMTNSENFINLSDPKALYPLETSSQIKRIEEKRADFDGKVTFEIDVQSGLENGYYIVSVSQSGSVDAECSSVIYFEKKADAALTVYEINNASKTETDRIINEKPLFFGFNRDYEKYDSSVLDLFISVKEADFGRSFACATDVRKAFLSAVCLDEINENPDSSKEIIESNAEILSVDLSDENYNADKSAVMKIFANVVAVDKFESISELNKAFCASIGTALANRSTQSDIDSIIKKYGDAIGISHADYTSKCNKYTATNINKIFVKANFKTPADMVKAYNDRITALENATETPSGGGGGGGGNLGGGSAGGGGFSVTAEPEEEVPQVIGFNDLNESHWAYSSVMKMKSQNVISGYEDNSFRPDNTVTREEFVKMIISAMGYYDGSAECEFSDVSSGRWSYPYVASAVKRGLVNGIGENQFGATMNITREDAAVIIYRIIKDETDVSAPTFEDASEISSYAKEAVGTLYANGIVNGMSETHFAPKTLLTRAQTAVLVENVIKFIN